MEVRRVENSSEIENFMEIIKSAWHSDSALSGFKDTIHSMAYHGGFVLGAWDEDEINWHEFFNIQDIKIITHTCIHT